MINLPFLLLPAVAAAALSWAFTPAVCRFAWRIGAVDTPGPRRLHKDPVPRIGGVAVTTSVLLIVTVMWLGLVPGIPVVSGSLAGGLLLGALPVAVVSLWDDLSPLGPLLKLLGHAIAAVVAMAFGLRLAPEVHLFGEAVTLGIFAFPLSFVWIVGVTNAFNLVDGLDGLSAGLATISAFSVAMLALIFPNAQIAAVSLVIVGTLIGFLPYNVYPARAFLGDVGAATLGFWLACLALPGGATLSTGMAVAVPILAMGVPIADTLLSIFRRSLRPMLGYGAAGIFEPDLGHIHHKLVQIGITRPRAVLLLCGVGFCAAGVGILSLFVTNSNAALLLATLVAAAFIGVGRLGYDEFAVLRRGVILHLYDIPLVKLGLFRVFVDMALVATAFYCSVVLKYDDMNIRLQRHMFLNTLALMLPVTLAVFWTFRLYHRSWRFAGMSDVIGAVAAVLTSTGTTLMLGRLFVDETISLSLFVIHTALLLLLIGGARSSFKALESLRQGNKPDARPVLIYGAGDAGLAAVRELRINTALGFRVVGFLDDDSNKLNRRIGGWNVLGAGFDLDRLITTFRVAVVIVSTDKIEDHSLRNVSDVCLRRGVTLLRFSLAVRFDAVNVPVRSTPDLTASHV